MSIATLIQQKVPLGSNLCVILKNGEKKSGVLEELSKSHIVIKNGDMDSIVFLDMIGGLEVSNSFDDTEKTISVISQPVKESSDNYETLDAILEGCVQNFMPERGYGFINDSNANKYYFSKGAVIDEDLMSKLMVFKFGLKKIPVIFESSKKSTGKFPVANKISLSYKPAEIFKKAKVYASNGDYQKAIMFVKRLLFISPDFPKANEYVARWKEQSLIASLSRFSSPYLPVKRSQLVETDYEHAKKVNENLNLADELFLLKHFQISTNWLSTSLSRIDAIDKNTLSKSDAERLRDFKEILNICLELCTMATFEGQERLCLLIENRCNGFLSFIDTDSTNQYNKVLHNIASKINTEICKRLSTLYELSKPQLSLSLPIETYFPDNKRGIDLQITVANRQGCSPAESVEIVIQPDDEYFSVLDSVVSMRESLIGGMQKTFVVSLSLTSKAIKEQTFTMSVYVQYRTRSDEMLQTGVYNFFISLHLEDEFEEIDNPYAIYTESGVVSDPQMFYGREELINSIANALYKAKNQGKSILVYGQKRAGKSSVLYHLKKRLEWKTGFLVIDIGNIGSILDETSKTPLLYQILWIILSKLRDTLEDRVEDSPFYLELPKDTEFYNHSAPLSLFKDIFSRFRRSCLKNDNWKDIKIVLLVDEFSYLYGQILKGSLPDTFMKNWKALLQEGYFNCVLAGQDVMPKFKQAFPNEFGTTQDEKVTYLTKEDAIRLIDEPIRISGKKGESRYRGKAIERMLHLTAGSPFYIQMLCNRLVEYMNRKKARLVTEADIEQVKNEMIRGANAISIDRFDNLFDSGDISEGAINKEYVIRVLTVIAKNSQQEYCHKDSICESDSSIDKTLNDLVNRDVLIRERENYYQIKVGLFKEWLNANG